MSGCWTVLDFCCILRFLLCR